MRLRSTFVAMVTALGLSAVHAVAEDATWEWIRISPANSAYSIEVPCNAEQVAKSKEAVLLLDALLFRLSPNASNTRRHGQVVCIRDDAMFSARVVVIDESERPATTAYDQLLGALRAKGDLLAEKTVSGRRALLRKEPKGEQIRRTGIVELSDSSYLYISVGSMPDNRLTPASFDVLLDRFLASVEIAST